jgi:DNA segregation ATPase FtsK/SpoIIIE, S-DNA-T family
MLQNRRLVSDLIALTLLGIVVFLASSLATYDPADPLVEAPPPLNQLYRPDVIVYPVSEHVGNACGRWGALVADVLLTGLGIGAFYLVLSLAVLDFLLLRRHPIDTPLIRGVGWIATLIGFTTIAAIIVPAASLGPVIGSGGYLGALGKGLLQMHFATAGSLILALSLVAGGLLLCTDYVLLRMVLALVAYTLIVVGKSLKWGPQNAAKRKTGRRGAEADVEDDLDDDGPVTIKFSGRTTSKSAAKRRSWKNVRRFRLQRPRRRDRNRPGHRPVRSGTGSRPAAVQDHRLADDLAIALRVPSVRIVAPIPGKNTVGIEVPNEQRQVVRCAR